MVRGAIIFFRLLIPVLGKERDHIFRGGGGRRKTQWQKHKKRKPLIAGGRDKGSIFPFPLVLISVDVSDGREIVVGVAFLGKFSQFVPVVVPSPSLCLLHSPGKRVPFHPGLETKGGRYNRINGSNISILPSLPPSFHLDKEEEAPISCREEEEEEGMERDGEKSLVITNSSFSRTFQLLLLLSPFPPNGTERKGKGGIFYFP